MFGLVLILGLLSAACGLFVVAFGVPIRETAFGSALLVAGAVAISGGFITLGLAATVAELRRVIAALKVRAPAVPRPLRPVDRTDGTEKRPGPPRIPFAGRPSAEIPTPPAPPTPTQPLHQVASTQRVPAAHRMPPVRQGQPTQSASSSMPDFPEAARGQPTYAATSPPGPSWTGREHSAAEDQDGASRDGTRSNGSQPGEPHPSSPEWLRRAFAEISTAHLTASGGSQGRRDDPRSADDWPETSPLSAAKSIGSSEGESLDFRPRGDGGEGNKFDTVWPSGRSRPTDVPIAENRDEERREVPSRRRAEPASRLAETQPAEIVTPAGRSAIAPGPPASSQSILKSGVIDEMAYTLFTDGSIEAQMPDGTMRFASIEELRRHLDTQGG